MKRNKKLLILFIVLVIACIATLIATKTKEKQEKIKTTDQVILSIDPDEVETLSWTYGENSLAFHRDDSGNWIWDEDEAFPVDNEAIQKLLDVFSEFGASFIIEDAEDLGQYGLTDPTCTIDIATADKTYQVLLGETSKMDSQRYVSTGDGNVYLVSTDPYENYEITRDDTMLNDDVPAMDSVKSIEFKGTENYTVTYSDTNDVTYCESDHYFTEKNGTRVALDSDKIESYTSALSSLTLTDYASYNVTDEELAAWGLDDPEQTVTVNYTDTDEDGNETSESVTLYVGRNQEELAAAEKAATNHDEEDDETSVTSYVRVGDSKIVYRLTAGNYNDLTDCGYNDLRHDSVFTADMDQVTGMDISLDGEAYSITSEMSGSKSDAERVFSYSDEEVDVETLKSDISDLKVTAFHNETAPEKVEIGLTIHLDNEKFPEIKIKLYRCDGDNCLVELDGQILGYVDRAAVVDLIEAVNKIIL